MIRGIAVLAVSVYLGSLTQLCHQGRTARGSVLCEERAIRPAPRNGSPRRADQRKYEQATSRYFGFLQMSTLQIVISEFK
jgi:hypothetical protein